MLSLNEVLELSGLLWNQKSFEERSKDSLQRTRARFFIRKAIGWNLREMSVKDPNSVLLFLKKIRDKMSGLSFREASRKLPKKYKKQL